MSDKFDWDKTISEWQNHEPKLPKLKKNMRWKSLRMKLVLALDVVAILVLIPLAYFIYLSNEPNSIKVWFSIICLMSAVGVYFDFYLRKDLWNSPNTTCELLDLQIKREQAGVNLAKFSIIYLSTFIFFIVIWWLAGVIFESTEINKRFSLKYLLVSIAFVASFIVASFYYLNLKRKKLDQAKNDYKTFISLGDE